MFVSTPILIPFWLEASLTAPPAGEVAGLLEPYLLETQSGDESADTIFRILFGGILNLVQ